MAGIREVDRRLVSRRKVSSLGEEESGGFTLVAPRYSPWTHMGGAQFMLMATTTLVAEFYSPSGPWPALSLLPEGRRRRGALRWAGAGEGAAGLGGVSRRGGRAAGRRGGPGEATP